jgi:hypothetical protein
MASVSETNDIHDNATRGSSSGGIGVGTGHDRTWIVNNTISPNGFNGISTPTREDVLAVNDPIVGNGTRSALDRLARGPGMLQDWRVMRELSLEMRL